MKRILLTLYVLLTFGLSGHAQSLTLEYNFGYGDYRMSEMKDYLKDAEIPFDGAEIVDNFPGYLTQDTRVGMEWGNHHFGVLFNYMNTAGKRGLTDYSGHYYFEMRDKGYKLGAFYRFRLANEPLGFLTFQPYLQLSAGAVLNKVKLSEDMFFDLLPDQTFINERKLSGTNFFVEPAFGVKIGLCRYAALNVSVGYEWDPFKGLHASDSGAPAVFDADWSGYCTQVGLIFYWHLKK